MNKKLLPYLGCTMLWLLAGADFIPTAQAQNEDPLHVVICDTAGDCCLDGQGQAVRDAWIDPGTGNLHVTGAVRCRVPGLPEIVEFSASPSPVAMGEELTIQWSASGVEECVAAGSFLPWEGSKPWAGSESHVVEGPPDTHTIWLTCWNSEGGDQKQLEFSIVK